MFFIITWNFPKVASKLASVFHLMLPGTCDEASLSFPLSTRLHLTTTYKRTTSYGVLMKAGKKVWNTFHLVLIIHQDVTQCKHTRYRLKNVHFHFRNYWGNNLSKQPTSVVSVSKSMPGCFLPTRTDSKIGCPFHHITISSQYPLQRINVSILLNRVLCSFILLRFTKFIDEMEAFLLNFYNISIFYQCWATLMLFWNNKKG